MIYEKLKKYNDDDIKIIMSSCNNDDIKILPLSIGEYSENLIFAQDFCIQLLENSNNNEVRANAILGLSYLARRFRVLDKKVMPYLKEEMEKNTEFVERIKYSIEDINLFLNL